MNNLSLTTLTQKHYLSKSDYKVARDCPVKLYYKKMGYPTTMEEDEYLQLLAECGYMVGKLAQLYYPGGIEVEHVTEPFKAVERTEDLLKQDQVILFEPAIYHENILVRVDILVKNGNRFEVIEVKSKSYISKLLEDDKTGGKSIFRNKRDGSISAEWKPYIEDVAYQAYVLKRKFPGAEVHSFLLMPDKSKNTNIEGLPGLFRITDSSNNPKYKKLNVEFTGSLQEIQNDDILTKVDVTDETQELTPVIEDALKIFLPSVKEGYKKIQYGIDKNCKNCEFRGNANDHRDGFKECWGDLAEVSPHIFDLYYIGSIQKGDLANKLIKDGKVSLYDIPTNLLTGTRGERQMVQIVQTKKNEEWIANGFKDLLKKYEYPLYFIDFETSRIAMPYHKKMSPYENVAFQWSAHVIRKPGAKVEHYEWINAEESFPNFEFAETLMKTIGDKGSIFRWAAHENTILRDIHNQMIKYNYVNDELTSWLQRVVKFDKADTGLLIDMCQLCRDYYFHPMMKGSNSLKYVLPAIWNANKKLHTDSLFSRYYKEENGKIFDPYETLPKLDIMNQNEIVNEGGGAMMAYQEMMYGLQKDDKAAREQWKKLLLQYCELDTAAMVMVWYHWNGL